MTEETGIKQRPGRHRKIRVLNKSRLFFFMFFCLVFFTFSWFLAGGVKTFILKQFVKIEALQPGVAAQDFAGQGILIKQEYLVNAPVKGVMKFSLPEGERVKTGTTFGILSASSMESVSGVKQYAVKAPVSGVVCNHMDGLETILVPGNLDVVEISALDKIENSSPPVQAGLVESGQPVAKIIDNLAPVYIYSLFKEEETKQIQLYKKSGITIKWKNEAIEARIDKVFTGKQPAILFMVKNYPDELLHHRKINFHLTTAMLKGILVEEKSLVQRDDQDGLYLVWKGLVRWVPVEIAGRLGEQVAIQGKDIQPGILYVVNPTFAREGDKL
ncbi:MAG: hypothetical protein M1119_10760 [Firmicutes bacterium]|nr:hypothetical protein [Bacillota bacterium]